MNFHSYLIFMALGTVTAWISWAVVLHGVDPTRAGGLGFVLFYVTLSMALFGSTALLGMLLRMWRTPDQLPSRIVSRSSRQGILFTGLFVSSLLLVSHGWFRWWTMILVVLIVGMIEMLFLSSARHA